MLGARDAFPRPRSLEGLMPREWLKYPIAAHTFQVFEFSISQSPKTKNIRHFPLLGRERLENVIAHQDLRGYHL